MFNITVRNSHNNLEKLLKKVRQGSPDAYQQIREAIEELKNNPRPDGCRKMRPRHLGRYRIACGEYRVVYSIDDQNEIVCILLVAHRKDVYRH